MYEVSRCYFCMQLRSPSRSSSQLSAERHSAGSHCCTRRALSCFERRLCNAQSRTCLTCRPESLTCRRGHRVARPKKTSMPSSRPSTRSTLRPCRAGPMRARTRGTLRWRRRHSRPLRVRCVPRSLRCAYDAENRTLSAGPLLPPLLARPVGRGGPTQGAASALASGAVFAEAW